MAPLIIGFGLNDDKGKHVCEGDPFCTIEMIDLRPRFVDGLAYANKHAIQDFKIGC